MELGNITARETGFKMNDRVIHRKYGEGTVIGLKDNRVRLTVEFDNEHGDLHSGAGLSSESRCWHFGPRGAPLSDISLIPTEMPQEDHFVGFKVKDRVTHKIFGDGTFQEVVDNGEMMLVEFDRENPVLHSGGLGKVPHKKHSCWYFGRRGEDPGNLSLLTPLPKAPEDTSEYHSRKFDKGKPDLAILKCLGRALVAVTGVLQAGAMKYEEDSFASVPNAIRRYDSAMMRHWLEKPVDPVEDMQEYADTLGIEITHDMAVAVNALFKLEIRLREKEKTDESN